MSRKMALVSFLFLAIPFFFYEVSYAAETEEQKVHDNFIGVWAFDLEKTIENDKSGKVWNDEKKRFLKNHIKDCIADIKVNGDIIYDYNDGSKIAAKHKIVKSTPQELVLEGTEVPGNKFTAYLFYVDSNYIQYYSMLQPFHKNPDERLRLYFKRKK